MRKIRRPKIWRRQDEISGGDAVQEMHDRIGSERRPQRASRFVGQSKSIYHGVDITSTKYRPLRRLSLREFPGRVHFHPGDSREVLPYLAMYRRNWNLIFSISTRPHGRNLPRDISNCLPSPKEAWQHLLLDDIKRELDFYVYCEFVSMGYLTTETFFDDWKNANRNVLARIPLTFPAGARQPEFCHLLARTAQCDRL